MGDLMCKDKLQSQYGAIQLPIIYPIEIISKNLSTDDFQSCRPRPRRDYISIVPCTSVYVFLCMSCGSNARPMYFIR